MEDHEWYQTTAGFSTGWSIANRAEDIIITDVRVLKPDIIRHWSSRFHAYRVTEGSNYIPLGWNCLQDKYAGQLIVTRKEGTRGPRRIFVARGDVEKEQLRMALTEE